MPPRWIHNALDLFSTGRVRDDVHAWKDAPAQTLGAAHRIERHEWYQAFGTRWTWDDPFPLEAQWDILRTLRTDGPDAAECHQADLAHDFWDRIWDECPRRKRTAICQDFKALLLNPELLKRIFKIDVIAGRAVTENLDGDVAWEDEPDLNLAWRKLKAYVEGRPIEDLVIGR